MKKTKLVEIEIDDSHFYYSSRMAIKDPKHIFKICPLFQNSFLSAQSHDGGPLPQFSDLGDEEFHVMNEIDSLNRQITENFKQTDIDIVGECYERKTFRMDIDGNMTSEKKDGRTKDFYFEIHVLDTTQLVRLKLLYPDIHFELIPND